MMGLLWKNKIKNSLACYIIIIFVFAIMFTEKKSRLKFFWKLKYNLEQYHRFKPSVKLHVNVSRFLRKENKFVPNNCISMDPIFIFFMKK